MTNSIDPRWRQIPISAVSDALDRLGIAGQCSGIKPVTGPRRLAGRAFTLTMRPQGISAGTVGDYVDDVPPGSVVVIDNSGRVDATVWGGLLTLAARRLGLAGTVIDGASRDSADVGDYPLFARATWVRTGKGRYVESGRGVTVSIGGVSVEPGDIVLGDMDGVVIVPRGREGELLAAALEIVEAESKIVAAVESGGRLDEARRRYGYFGLQSRS